MSRGEVPANEKKVCHQPAAMVPSNVVTFFVWTTTNCRLWGEADASIGRSELRVARQQFDLAGGRTWWAQFAFTRMNISRIILSNQIEEVLDIPWFLRPCGHASARMWRVYGDGESRMFKDG